MIKKNHFFMKKIWMAGLLGLVLICSLSRRAGANICYCAGEAYSQSYVQDHGLQDNGWLGKSGYKIVIDNSDPPTCERCRQLCQNNFLAAFSWGSCWGQSIKKSNCSGC